MYSFEFDPKKSESNQKKHGIDFVQAQAIWQDTDFIEVMAKSEDEPRVLVVGMIDGEHWSPLLLTVKTRFGLSPSGGSGNLRWYSMKAKSLDKKFDNNQSDIVDELDLSTIKRPNQTQKRVNVDFPTWMIESLDKEATRLGVTRQSIIKIWLAERLEQSTFNKSSNRTQ